MFYRTSDLFNKLVSAIENLVQRMEFGVLEIQEKKTVKVLDEHPIETFQKKNGSF